MANADSESFKRLMDLGRIAGPDDPIYQGGVVMNSIRSTEPTEAERMEAKLLAIMRRCQDSALTEIPTRDGEE